jgi:hypothetical protein
MSVHLDTHMHACADPHTQTNAKPACNKRGTRNKRGGRGRGNRERKQHQANAPSSSSGGNRTAAKGARGEPLRQDTTPAPAAYQVCMCMYVCVSVVYV